MYVRQGRDCIQAGDQTDVAAVCCQFLTQQPYLDRIRWERFLCYACWIHHVIDWTPGSDSGLLHVLRLLLEAGDGRFDVTGQRLDGVARAAR